MTYEQRVAAEQEMDARDRGLISSRWQGRRIDEGGIAQFDLLSEMDIEEENEAGETAARGRLEGATTQRAAISEMDPSMVHEALMGDSAREAIINMYIFIFDSIQFRSVLAQLHSQRRGRRKRRERVYGSDSIDV